MTKLLVAFGMVLALRSFAEPEKFKSLTEEQLAQNFEGMCGFKLLVWFGDEPPKSLDLTGKKPVVRDMPPVFSKEFDKKYYDFLKRRKALQSEKSYEDSKKASAKLSGEFNEFVGKTEFYKTCQKISKKVAAACVKNQESLEDLQKCGLFYRDKYDILDRHNHQIMDIPELKKKAENAAKWLGE